MLRHPCILGDPQRKVRGAKSEVATSPLPSQGAKKRAEMLRHPCNLARVLDSLGYPYNQCSLGKKKNKRVLGNVLIDRHLASCVLGPLQGPLLSNPCTHQTVHKNKDIYTSHTTWAMTFWGHAQRTHDREKLGLLATIGNILDDADHTTPPQGWIAPAFDVHSVGEMCTCWNMGHRASIFGHDLFQHRLI